ncbi:HD-GYP domain-containing protein [Halarcobacter anaerophilus]|uniref:HD-GYP domain-containing protein n=1 Tax=Halarcobacter anaerophilus TaxID=877500 RepID=UPI0005CAA4B5|nr:HD domain-containing phosphohydrolase [Halarcobacter anaerophilus]
MDKKKEMLFNLNNFLLAMSTALDEVEKEVYKVSCFHSKRVAYLALKLAKEFNFEKEGLSDICSFALLHNIGLKKSLKKGKAYCLLGEEYSSRFPFLTDEKNIIKYHCEYYDGSGIFGLKGDEIPLFSQFLAFADTLDTKFDLSKKDINNRKEILEFVKKSENTLFSTDMVECFFEFSEVESFWLDLQNEQELLTYIFSSLFDFSIPLKFEDVLSLSSIFHELIDNNSNLISNCSKMADFYNFDHKDKQTFLIAASLANIGKFFIPSKILEKKDTLELNEYTQIKAYPYYTKKVLSNIIGFSDINNWASTIQEFIDKSGYPFCLEGKDLSLKNRLLTTTNIYTSLITEKTYRAAFSKEEAFKIMDKLSNDKRVDKSIVEDLKSVFS